MRRRVVLEWLAVAFISTLAVGVLTVEHATVRADNVVYDALSKLAQRAPVDDIVIVAIDNRSVEALGRWPWPRMRHVELLKRLAAARPKAIAYDVLFSEPDRDPAVDPALAQALRSAPATYLPLTFNVPGNNGAPFEVVQPIEPLRGAASAVGQANIEFDADGIVRRAFLVESAASGCWPHLMTFLLDRPSGLCAPARVADGSALRAAGAGLTRGHPVLISFAGPPGQFRTISFVDVLRGETPSQFLSGKRVLVGATADGLGDRYATPLSDGAEALSGVELQANLLDTLSRHSARRALTTAQALAFALAPLFLLLGGFLRLTPRANLALGAALIAATLGLSALLFLQFHLWAAPTTTLAGMLIVSPIWSWRRLAVTSAYMVEELDEFARDPKLLPQTAEAEPASGSEVIGRQVDLMRSAIREARDLRTFVTETLLDLPDPTFVIGADGKIVIANRQGSTLFEAVTGELSARADLSAMIALFTISNETDEGEEPDGAPLSLADAEIIAPDGRTFSLRRVPFQDASRQMTGWIVRLTDITPLKVAAQQREQVLQLLTHDMRSPQVSILSLLDGLDASERLTGLGERISHYARRTLALADNFVHLARAETQTYQMEVVNFSDLVLDAVDDLWPQASARQISVTANGCSEEYLIMADRSLLTRALINLVDNAIKYTDPGGRVVCTLSATASADGPNITCAIADNGRGMAPDELARLFERFQRAASAGRSRADGVGLGLAFSQLVVQRHGGEISCESRVGEGTTFKVSLPIET